MNNVIEYENIVIGKGKDVANYMLKEFKTYLENADDMDTTLSYLKYLIEVLKTLMTFEDTLVSVKECSMGGFIVKELGVD